MSIQKAVEQAVAESEVNGMSRRGKEATPWLLGRVLELTKGSSLASNIALLKNTALIGKSLSVKSPLSLSNEVHRWSDSC